MVKNMSQSTEMLRKIYKNAKVGVNTADALAERVESGEMKEILSYQKGKYMEIAKEAADLLAERRTLPPDIGFMEKMGLLLSVEMNLSCSAGKAAETVINGCTAGIVEITKLINSLPCDRRTMALARALADTEQKSMYFMRQYL